MNAADLLSRVLPRMAKLPEGSGVSFIDALNTAVDVFFERLHRKRSEIVRATFEDLDVGVADEVIDLPANFRGLVSGRLRLSSGTTSLQISELPADVDPPTSGKPAYFSLIGARQMQFYPASDADYTLEGGYYGHPGTMSMSSRIPWGGLFDNALADAVVAIAAAGSIETMQSATRGTLDEMIDGVLDARTVSPRRNRLW